MSFNIINSQLSENTLIFSTENVNFPAIQIRPTSVEALSFYGQTTETIFLQNILLSNDTISMSNLNLRLIY